MQRLIIITGASRGIGASISIQANKKFNESTLFLLIARDEHRLSEIKNEMNKSKSSHKSFENRIYTLRMDFSKSYKVNDMLELIRTTLISERLIEIKELYVFYNHGSLKISTIEKIADQAGDEFQINVCSVWTLMASIRQMFPLNLVPTQFHVNISSLWAYKLQESCSIYNATRSARATMFKCLALEQPFLRIFNYQPGAVYTSMQKQLYDNNTSIYETYRTDYDEGRLLQPDQTVLKLLEIIEKNEFENGADIDYYSS